MNLSSTQQNKWKQVLNTWIDDGAQVWMILGLLQTEAYLTMSSTFTPRERLKLEHLAEVGAKRLLCQALVLLQETFRLAGLTITTRK